MSFTPPESYFNRYDPAKRYEQHLFRAGYVMQSAEFNELQSASQYRLQQIADALLRDGDIISGGDIVVDAVTGACTCNSGAIYLRGAVRGIAPAALTISSTGVVQIGVYLTESVVTEFDDPTLRDPAIGMRNYGEPGAARLQVTVAWGIGGASGEFYPIWTVIDGAVVPRATPPSIDAISVAIAAYDRQSTGGTYGVSGLRVSVLDDLPTGEQVYSIAAGEARIGGRDVVLPTARRLVDAAVPDLHRINNEPTVSSGTAAQRVTFARPPMASLIAVSITTDKTVTLTHGAYTGVLDSLPDDAVLQILSVTQGATTYVQGTDYRLTAGKVDWSLMGAEPSPGSSYSVTYRYIANATPSAVDERGFTVSGAVAGTLIQTTYDSKLPRVDRLCLSASGELVWVRGVSAEDAPLAPAVPADLLLLATVWQTWVADTARTLRNDGVKVVPMADIEDLRNGVLDLYDLVAQQRLTVDVNARLAAASKGLFVDPFTSNAQRDAGIEQSAVIYDGLLMLPVSATVLARPVPGGVPAALAHDQQSALAQTMITSSMAVNPYDAFAPLPAQVILSPSVDNAVQTTVVWAPDLFLGRGNAVRYVRTQQLDATVVDLFTLRQIRVAFTVSGFGPGERVSQVRFDGIDVTASVEAGLNANAAGVVSGHFTVPPNVPSGTKLVEFAGSGGSYGSVSYVGSNVLVKVTQQKVYKRYWSWPVDPLAQTFMVDTTRQVSGVELWFTAKGSSAVIVQIRETDVGFPARTILAEARVQPADIALGGAPTRLLFPELPTLSAGVEYALVVLCNDALTAVSVAQLGKWDTAHGRWVTNQPYQVGVLLSSSNASTWTAHQDMDLTFQVLAPHFTETARTIDLGTIDVTAATDLMVLADTDVPSASARCEFRLTLLDEGNRQVTVSPYQAVTLAASYTGRITLEAILSGTAAVSPVLFPDVQLAVGTLVQTALYVTREFPANGGTHVLVVFDAVTPGASQITVEISNGGTWTTLALDSGSPIEDDWVERVYVASGFSGTTARLRLTLTGDTAARPLVRNLRCTLT